MRPRHCQFCEHTHFPDSTCYHDRCSCPGARNWVDWVVVERVIRGYGYTITRPLTFAERCHITRRLLDSGAGVNCVQKTLRVNGLELNKILSAVRTTHA